MIDYNTPENHAAFCAAMATAQGQISNITKGAVNPHFRSNYSDLASIRAGIHEVLAKNGLFVMHKLVTVERGLEVRTTVGHAGGYREPENVFFIPVARMDAQSLGSASTYGQRYVTMGLFGLAGEDDDGNAATAAANGRQAAPAPTGPISPDQVEILRSTIVEVAADLPRFLKVFGITRVEEMPAARYEEARKMLDLKRQQFDKIKGTQGMPDEGTPSKYADRIYREKDLDDEGTQ